MSDNLPVVRKDAFMQMLQQALVDPSFDTAKFEILLDRYEKLQEREARREFNEAVAAIQSELGLITKDRANPATRSRYATLEAIYREAAATVAKHGIAIRFGSDACPREGYARVTCILSKGLHEEVHHLDGPVSVEGARGGRTQMTDIQAVGSTITYLRRYLLMMVLNLVQSDDDDDGNGHQRSSDDRPPPVTRIRTPDPEPGEAPEDYEKRIGTRREQINREVPIERPVVSKPAPVSPPASNGTGESEGYRISKKWIHGTFKVAAEAITDRDAAAKLLQNVAANEEKIRARHPSLWGEFDQIRQAMITRLWPQSQ